MTAPPCELAPGDARSGVGFALAPSGDYRCDLPPEVEICSCDEALALRAELGKMHARLTRRERRPAPGLDAALARGAFCPLCGVGAGVDADGCCTTCGATVCAMAHLIAHLAGARLRVVSCDTPEPEGDGDGDGI